MRFTQMMLGKLCTVMDRGIRGVDIDHVLPRGWEFYVTGRDKEQPVVIHFWIEDGVGVFSQRVSLPLEKSLPETFSDCEAWFELAEKED